MYDMNPFYRFAKVFGISWLGVDYQCLSMTKVG